MKKFFNKRLLISLALVSVPVIAATISTFHLIELFNLGNKSWMSIMLGVTYELGSLSIMAALAVLKYIKKGIIWSLFIILFLMQLVGNVYATFDYINIHSKSNPEFLESFIELYVTLVGFFMDSDPETINTIRENSKVVLALIIGIPIPLISIGITKSLVDYLDNTRDENISTNVEEEESEIEPKTETFVENESDEEVDINNVVDNNPVEQLQEIENNKSLIDKEEEVIEENEPVKRVNHSLKPESKKSGIHIELDE